jgi:D-alanyl-D-alanine carboxypeptidase (penicillin-binding protein 5/6)
MNARARALGLTGTRYADASGFDPATVSTARDQARLAMAALARPSFAQIVAAPQVTLPVAGLARNRDELLGKGGIVGVKTGNTTAAGACFVFASRRLVGPRRVLVVGAVLDQPLTPDAPTLLDGAFASTTRLLSSVSLKVLGVLAHRRAVGWITALWGRRVPVRPAGPRLVLGWPGLPVHVHLRLANDLRAPLSAGQDVGRMMVRAGRQRVSLPLVVSGPLPSPSLGWRLTHP